MIRDDCPAGTMVWFLDGAFVRAARVVAIAGATVCLRAGMQLLLRVRKDVWANEAEALRSKAAGLAEQMAAFEVARGNALARLAELAQVEGPVPHEVIATATYHDGRVEEIHCCRCPGCDAAACCQS